MSDIMAKGIKAVDLDTTDIVNRFKQINPEGWSTTLMDGKRLRRLEQADVSELDHVVTEYGSNELQEVDVIRREALKVADSYINPEGAYDIPGLMHALDNMHLEKFAAQYVADADTPSGNIAPVELAGSSDVIFTFATPEVWGEISEASKPNFKQTGLKAGDTLELIGDAGIYSEISSADTALQLDSDEWLFFTGDVIDLSGNGAITKLQLANVDGETDYGPSSLTLQQRASDANILTGQGAIAQNELDLDAKIYQDGDAEPIPVAFYMAPGTKSPSLTISEDGPS